MDLKDLLFPPLNSRRSQGILPEVVFGEEIPKDIYQVSPIEALTPELRSNIQKLQEMNSGWAYHHFDDEQILEFIQENYGREILNRYLRISPAYGAARADLFRYLLIYKKGGVYLDIKSSMRRPLDEVLKRGDRYLLSYWNNQAGESFEGWGMHPELDISPRGELQQWFIVAAPGHPFLRAVVETVLSNIDLYNYRLHGGGRKGVLRTTGPIAYTSAILPHVEESDFRWVDSEADLGFEYSVYRNESHRTLFKKHYTQLSEPIVRMQSWRGLQSTLVGLLKRIHRH